MDCTWQRCPDTVDRLSKLLRERHPDWTLARFTADAGHDADATHRFLLGRKEVMPIAA